MKFELNEYHRNVSDEELIDDIKRVAKLLNKNSVTVIEYNENGTFHASTVQRRFGSWKKTLEICNLNPSANAHFKHNWTEDDVINDLKRVLKKLGGKALTQNEYDFYGKVSSSYLMRNFGNGSWNKVLELAGIEATQNRNFSNEDLFEEIERVWIKLGRQPTSSDINNGISKYSLNSYCRRFGGWRAALEAFVEYINNDDTEDTEETVSTAVEEQAISEYKNNNFEHKTNREANLRLRFLIMQRDNFKCCFCGASPAKDPSVQLHIDHIVPWSKGGETTMDNLQTLFSKCNLGKSNLQ